MQSHLSSIIWSVPHEQYNGSYKDIYTGWQLYQRQGPSSQYLYLSVWYYFILFGNFYFFFRNFQSYFKIVRWHCNFVLHPERKNGAAIFGGDLGHFVRCEHFAGLIAWPTQWRVAGKIHLNSLSQGLPPPLILQQVSTKVHLPSYFPSRGGRALGACSERITGPDKWPILILILIPIAILQAGPEQQN